MFRVANIKFTENPYICIRIGEGCPAACDSCKISIKNFPNPKIYDFDKIIKIIDESDKKFGAGFDFVFGNVNIIAQKDIIRILQYAINTGRKVRFQLSYNLNASEISLLQEIEKTIGSEQVYIKIAKNCKDDINWSRDLLILVKTIRKFSKLRFYIDIFIDISENIEQIKSLLKYSTSQNREHQYNIVLGDIVDIKFHDYSWKINDKDKTIDNLKGRDICQHLFQATVLKGDIFIQDSVDILINGDIFLHDNLCNIGDLMISNIFFDDTKIYTHFSDYLKYLHELGESSNSQADACYSCIKNKYSYLK